MMYRSLDWMTESQIVPDSDISVSISDFFIFRNILFISCKFKHPVKQIRSIFICFSNSVFVETIDLEAGIEREFTSKIDFPADATIDIKLGFEFADGSRFLIDKPSNGEGLHDSGNKIFARFAEIVSSSHSPAVLEVGSRARSGNTYRWFLPKEARYTGFDVIPGENVDILGDAHRLSDFLPRESFDIVYSIAVFEHIMMPWKVAVEMNKVMKLGAVGFVLSHQTWPLHEEPWDFWRFSNRAWHALFNKFTGFEIIESGMFERAYVVPVSPNAITFRMEDNRAYLGSDVLFRKIGPSSVDWLMDPAELLETPYPG